MKHKDAGRHAADPAATPATSGSSSASAAAVSHADAADTGTANASAATSLAHELRRQRRSKGMSLDDLANASGVSRAMISKIERMQSSPSTSILSKLVDALDTTVARLLGQESVARM